MPSLSSYLGLPPRSSNAAAGLRPRIPRPYEGVLAHSFERVGGIGEDLGSHDLAVPEPVEPERRLDISFPALLRPQVSSGTPGRSRPRKRLRCRGGSPRTGSETGPPSP